MSTEFVIDAPNLMEALNDDGAAEVLRLMQQRAAPSVIADLCRLVSRPAAWVQAKIDLLTAARLVSAVRAGRGHRSTRYAAVPPPIRIRFRGGHPEDAAHLAEFVRVVRARVDRKIAEVGSSEKPGGPAWSFDSLYLPVMSAKERDELISRIRRVIDFLAMLEQRRGSRRPARRTIDERTEPSTQHVVELRVRPLRSTLPAELAVEFFTSKPGATKATAPAASIASLAPRELQIARALADGLSRPQIAKLLGLSPNTVVTLSARVHRKLGVRSRAQLTRAMLAEVPGAR